MKNAQELFKSHNLEDLYMVLSQTDYFIAPASSKYHNNFEGGLYSHSLNVYTSLLNLNETMKLGLTDRECFIIGIAHDFCKIGLYVPNILKSGQQSEAQPYISSDEYPLGHGEKSLYLLTLLIVQNKLDIEIDNKISLAIRWHEGPYNEDFKRFVGSLEKLQESKIVYATIIADSIASKLMETKQ